MHTDLRYCQSSIPRLPQKALINALAAKVFHFVIPSVRLEAFPFAWRQFLLFCSSYLCCCCCCFWLVCVWVCVCRRKAARAFHHRHNLNSNINNLKWFVFFPSCCQLRRLRFTCFSSSCSLLPGPTSTSCFCACLLQDASSIDPCRCRSFHL